MRRMYSNPNAGRRTFNFGRVHQTDLEGLLQQHEIDATQLSQALTVMGQVKKENKAEDSFLNMYSYLRELQKARRLHKRRPYVPQSVMRQMVRLRLATPVRL